MKTIKSEDFDHNDHNKLYFENTIKLPSKHGNDLLD
jgi:hypothetical protein